MSYNDELYHFGVLGMKWGVRKAPERLSAGKGTSSTTKKVIKNYNRMDNRTFKGTYGVSKNKYAKRVAKYGDPYMNSPLAKVGKKLERKPTEKSINKAERKKVYKDIYSKESLGSKLVYSSGTYKTAAKYVVNNDMSISDATKKAKGQAWKNTAAFLAIYGGLSAAAIYKMAH